MTEYQGRAPAPLRNGKLDIIGDVHGEMDALHSLIGHLGYEEDGEHPDGRHLVFVGDLCDRGPDSPSVLDMVMGWVQAERAQCLLGNHELNVLLHSPKPGNGWFFDRNHDIHDGEFLHSRAATPARRAHWLEFINQLPVALARDDLRVVHACWDIAAMHALDAKRSIGGWRERHKYFSERVSSVLRESGLNERAALEEQRFGNLMENRAAEIPLLEVYAEKAAFEQNENPLKVLTSGFEFRAVVPAWAGGKWRMTNRSRWWQTYRDEPAVVIGHYWRRDARATREAITGDWDYPLDDYGPYEWMGPRRNVFCVDYSVGRRYEERDRGREAPFESRLAAMRWPERELVFDDGEQVATFESR